MAEFFLHPDHDGRLVHERLRNVATTSPLWLQESAVTVIVEEQPWAMKYRLKAYARDSREQKKFSTDLTLRAKAIFREISIRPAQAAMAVPR